MATKEIKDDKYQVSYEKNTATVTLQGAFLLNGATAYEPILNLLKEVAEATEPNQLTIDIRNLTFLNSSGINMMTKFVMYVSDVKDLKLNVNITGYKHVAWQERLTVNLRRLMPNLQANLE